MKGNDRSFPFLSLIPVARSYCHMQRERAAHSGTRVLSALARELTNWYPRPSIQAHLARMWESYSKEIPLIVSLFCFCTQLYLVRTEPMILCAKMFQNLFLVTSKFGWSLGRMHEGTRGPSEFGGLCLCSSQCVSKFWTRWREISADFISHLQSTPTNLKVIF